MNKLKGKALEDFLKYTKEVHDNDGLNNFGKRLFYISSIDEYKFIETDHYIHNIGNSMLNALITEYFDSVGIYISIEHNKKVGFMYILDECCENGFLTRQEATEKAIEQANLIYNERV